ncbi:LPXTG cell wall anchor domain-containing protein [Yinghuangia sp. YIM S09857]|uniref:LPXTG cell wall anchor domain-containing protein n=1 Tax=Yinghuangia sp. YIM S09857 TaxID=3436929 RepID=UPI003F53A9B8
MPHTPARGRSRTPATATALGAATLAVAAAVAPPAAAAESATSKSGGRLTVSKTQALNPAGETVTVTGAGFGRVRAGGHNGIYVSLCQSQGPGKLATPCVGGVDMEGASGSSLWIGDKVPPYGAGLAKPFNKGAGAFEYRLTLKAKDEFVDCTKVSCVVQVRADHTSSGDRADDAVVPVTWSAGPGSSTGDTSTGGTTGGTTTGNSSAANGSTSSTTTNGSSTSANGSASSGSSATAATGQTTDGGSASGGSAAGGTDTDGGAAGGASGADAAEALPKTGGTERTIALAFGATALVTAGTAAVLAAFRRRNTPATPTT